MSNERGYSRLRAMGFAMGGAALALFGGGSRTARAAPVALPFNVPVVGGIDWGDISNSTVCANTLGLGTAAVGPKAVGLQGKPSAKGKGTTTCGLGITDATQAAAPSLSDAFDGALGVAVNGAIFRNGTGQFDYTGTTATSATVATGGLQTTVQYYFAPGAPVVRALYRFSNPGASAVAANVVIGSNLGSDGGTIVESTQSGNAIVENTDRWIVTSDAAPFADPPILWVRFGAGAPVGVTASPQIPGPSNGLFADRYSLSVPAGGTRSIMVFARLNNDAVSAAAAAPAFADLGTLQTAGLLAGLTQADLSQLANWAPAAPTGTAPTAVPTHTWWGRLMLLFGLGAAGMLALVGMRRRAA
jgi:hypothetical protein